MKHHAAAGLCVLLIAGVCVAGGILCTTKFGKELREKMKIRAIDTAEDIKGIVIREVDTVKAAAASAADKVVKGVEDTQWKTESIKEEILDGRDEIKKDMNETAEQIVKTFHGEDL